MYMYRKVCGGYIGKCALCVHKEMCLVHVCTYVHNSEVRLVCVYIGVCLICVCIRRHVECSYTAPYPCNGPMIILTSIRYIGCEWRTLWSSLTKEYRLHRVSHTVALMVDMYIHICLVTDVCVVAVCLLSLMLLLLMLLLSWLLLLISVGN